MIQFKLNGQSIAIPTSWNDVTFAQYLKIFEVRDDVIHLVSIFTGLEYDKLKESVIVGLDKLLQALSFTNEIPKFPDYVDQCGPYKIPGNSKGQFNIQYESLGQFEDARRLMNQLTGDVKQHTAYYAKYVAIYLQKIKDGSYNPNAVEDMEKEIMTYPAYQVITLGAFFFIRLKILSGGIKSNSPTTKPSPKKSKRVLTPSKRSSGATRK